MTPAGRHEADRYVPEASVQRFEIEYGRVLADQRCPGCRRPLGSAPRRLIDRKQYHGGCEPK